MTPGSRDGSGVAHALAAIFAGVLGGVALKLMAVTPPGQAIVERSAIAGLMLLALVVATGAPLLRMPVRAWARAALDAVAALTFALAVFELPLALLSALIATLPLVTTLMSRAVLREPVGPTRAAALVVGFAGVLWILQPGLAISPLGLGLALVSVLAYAARDVATRTLPPGTATLSVALVSSVMVAAATLALSGGTDWIVPPAGEVGLAVLTAVCFLSANTLIIVAFRRGGVSAIAPLRYTAILWALLFDAAIWGVFPDSLAALGIGLILAAGGLMMRTGKRREGASPGRRR